MKESLAVILVLLMFIACSDAEVKIEKDLEYYTCMKECLEPYACARYEMAHEGEQVCEDYCQKLLEERVYGNE